MKLCNKLWPVFLTVALLLTGCGLIPKPVEFGQDKVEKMPVAKASEREIQRQTVDRLAEATEDTLRAAIEERTSANVLVPASDSAVLARAVKTSIGPPLKPASENLTNEELARRLETAVAKLTTRVEEFRSNNDQNAGKKIEGTGFLQIPYFVWLLIVAAAGFVGLLVLSVLWTVLKMYSASNPPVALGLKAVQMGGKATASLVSQLVKGGEQFKEMLDKTIQDPTLKEKVLETFRTAQMTAQSPDNQEIVKELTRK